MLKYLIILLFLFLALAIWYRAAAEGSILLFDEGHGQPIVAGGTRPGELTTPPP